MAFLLIIEKGMNNFGHIFWEMPVISNQEKTCWLNKSNCKSKFAWGMNNFRLNCMQDSTAPLKP